jgi:hypothetical protein
MNELINEYPEFKNRNGIEVQRWKICPIEVGSQHDDGSLTITKDAADIFASQIEHTPLMYAEADSKLPKTHRTDNKRKVIGSGLKGFIMQDEDGVEWLTGDYAVYTDADPDIINKVKEFKNDVGSSYEIHQSLIDMEGNVYDGGYSGTSVVDKDHAAYRHQALLIADKTGVVDIEPTKTDPTNVSTPATVITVDDILKDLIGNDYKSKVSELELAKTNVETEIESLKAEYEKSLAEKDQTINQLKKETDNLRELNNGFVDLT